MFDILIADDHNNWRDNLREILSRYGEYRCDVAQNYQEAEEKISNNKYRLLLLNFEFGVKAASKKLLRLIKQSYPDLPVIIITGAQDYSLPKMAQNTYFANFQARYEFVKDIEYKGDLNDERYIDGLLADIEELIGESESYPTTPLERNEYTLRIPNHEGRSTMQSVSWLHLSDLHISVNHYKQDKVLKHLMADISSRSGFDFIVVTGDITNRGQRTEFEQAKLFFDDLLATTKVSKECLFVVPGNHDVDWKKLDEYRDFGVSSRLTNRDEVLKFFSSKDKRVKKNRQEIFERLGAYGRFVNSYLVDKDGNSISPYDIDHYYYARTLTNKVVPITLIGFNSAWSSAVSYDYQKHKALDKERLLLGEPQVDQALELAKFQEGMTIGIIHHPLEWLYSFDRDYVQIPIYRQCDLFLHGHEHRVDIRRESSPGASVVILGNGPVYENSEERNCYFSVDLNLVTGKGTVKMRRYSPNDGGGWVIDTISKVYTSRPGEIDFEILPKIKKNTHSI